MLSEFMFRSEQLMHPVLSPSEGSSTLQDSKKESLLPEGAKLDSAGNLCWYNKPGQLHRENGPARISPHGDKEWWVNGKRHRLEDLPAIEQSNGTREWWVNGKRHRIGAPSRITSQGDKYWDQDGRLHRIDGPAIEYKSGGKKYFQKGAFHREDGPAIDLPANDYHPAQQVWFHRGSKIDPSLISSKETAKEGISIPSPLSKATSVVNCVNTEGTEIWFDSEAKLHREDGPALIYKNGHTEWYFHGKLHRDGGPAVIYTQGTQCWYQNGKLHRDDGPAITNLNGKKEWYRNGQRHREDGPALENPAIQIVEWYLFNTQLSEEGFRTRMRMVPQSSNSWISSRRENIQEALDELSGTVLDGLNSTTNELTTTTMAYDHNSGNSSSTTETKSPASTTEKKKKAKNWPDDPSALLTYEEIYAPLKQVLEDGYGLRRKEEKWSFEYDGYDLGKLEKKDFPPINDQLTEKFLKSEKEKTSTLFPKGITLCDTVMRVMFQMGLEQGRRMAYREQHQIKDLNKVLNKYREKLKNHRYQLALALATLKVKEENANKDYATVQKLIAQELEKTRKLRVEEIKNDLKMDASRSIFKVKQKKKAKLGDLVAVASSLDPEVIKMPDWISLLQEAGCTLKEWKSFCQKKQFTKFTG